MPTVPEPIIVTQRVIHLFEELAIPYVIGGSFASAAYGLVRTTMDVDIVADMMLAHIHPFVAALKDEFYVDALMIQNGIQHRSSFNLIHLQTMFKVDVFIPKARPFDREQLSTRVARPLTAAADEAAYFTTPELTILAKLDWYRLGGEVSDRQWQDVQGILTVRGTQLDFAYLRQWAANLSVTDLLEKAIDAAGLDA